MDVTHLLDHGSVGQNYTIMGDFLVYRGQLRDGTTVKIKRRRRYVPVIWAEKFLKLLDIWAKCSHSNIIQLIGKATVLGNLAVVYHWHEYGGVTEYLRHHPTADRYQLSVQICDGVAYLHGNGIVTTSQFLSCVQQTHLTPSYQIHGDLGGLQILVSGDGVPRIPLSVLYSSTIANALGGPSSCWSAPEILKGSKRILASDVYSLGMTILETITGKKHSYADEPGLSWIRKMKIGEPPSRPADTIPQAHAGNVISDILHKCWSYNPRDRPSVVEVRDIMYTVYQTPDGMALKTLKLVVTKDTTVQDLVAHYEQRRLTNYTHSLQQTDIANTIPFIDATLANVYKVNISGQQCVAVKCVKHTTPHKKLKRAGRELSSWSSYKHENILPVLGFAVFRGDLAIVSPWMRNGHVSEYVANHPNCDCLGLVHGDIKGPNVLVSDIGTVQVMDFGVSITDHQEIEFSSTSTGGTQRWLVRTTDNKHWLTFEFSMRKAPEILLGQTDSTKEADVYALSMTMIETGEQPYGSTNWFQLMMPVIHSHLRPARPVKLPIDDVGNGIWGLMCYCWLANPSKRLTAGPVHDWLQYYYSITTATRESWQ
ncbi:kinase-like domain-containing protein [Rhizoctonia solani]|nr:kinase-like domain-containing protein [Rhizoctonia solani]